MRVTAVLLCMFLSACTVQGQYVEADRATYNAVAHEYVKYVEHDWKLDDRQKKRRVATVQSWDARLTEAEK